MNSFTEGFRVGDIVKIRRDTMPHRRFEVIQNSLPYEYVHLQELGDTMLKYWIPPRQLIKIPPAESPYEDMVI